MNEPETNQKITNQTKIPCKNPDCNNTVIFKSAKKGTGYCYTCSIPFRGKTNLPVKIAKKVECKNNSNCGNFVGKRCKTGYCNSCKPEFVPRKKKDPKPPEQHIKLCPNPNNNDNCLVEIVYADKYGLAESIKYNRCCKVCASECMVMTRMNNNSYQVTDETRRSISEGLQKIYEDGSRTTWNKGLNAKTDDRVAKMGKSRPGELNPMFGRSYKDIWVEQYDEDELIDKLDYNGYLKSMSELTFEEWKIDREIHRTEYDKYRKEVYFWTDKNDLTLLTNYDKRGKASRNVDAYHLDHIIPISVGFKYNIDARWIARLDNLRFIPWRQNIQKSDQLYGSGHDYELLWAVADATNHGIIPRRPLPKLIKISDETTNV